MLFISVEPKDRECAEPGSDEDVARIMLREQNAGGAYGGRARQEDYASPGPEKGQAGAHAEGRGGVSRGKRQVARLDPEEVEAVQAVLQEELRARPGEEHLDQVHQDPGQSHAPEQQRDPCLAGGPGPHRVGHQGTHQIPLRLPQLGNPLYQRGGDIHMVHPQYQGPVQEQHGQARHEEDNQRDTPFHGMEDGGTGRVIEKKVLQRSHQMLPAIGLPLAKTFPAPRTAKPEDQK